MGLTRGGLYFGEGSRGICAGGGTPWTDRIDYVTIQSPGNSTTFGDLSAGGGKGYASTSSSGGVGYIIAGHDGADPWVSDDIRYITIATPGNSQSWGNLGNETGHGAACSSYSRVLHFGGEDGSPSWSMNDRIEYFSTAAAGNASSFGNISSASNGISYTDACSNGIKGMIGNGYNNSWGQNGWVDTCSFDTPGNTTQFGNSMQSSGTGATSNGTRAFYMGGYINGSSHTGGWSGYNWIEYYTWDTTSNSSQYGNLSVSMYDCKSCSDGSRGLAWRQGSYQSADIEYFDLNGSPNITATSFGSYYDPQNGRYGGGVMAGD
jgi:hypothetical protein